MTRQPAARTALVTGAARGIGREITLLLAADGVDLVLVGRDREKLEALAAELRQRHSVAARVESCDLSEPRAALRLWKQLESAGVSIDILVNNAGSGLYGLVEEQDPDGLDRVVQLNVAALTLLTRLVLPGMRQRRWGRILNVGSVVGYQPGAPRMAAYYASKAYVLSLSRSLALELKGTGVSVTVLSPGPTATDFDDRAGATVDTLFRRAPKSSPAAVARAGYAGMMRGSHAVVPGIFNKLLAVAGELQPRRIALEVNRILWVPRGSPTAPKATAREPHQT